jgi:trigger factor
LVQCQPMHVKKQSIDSTHVTLTVTGDAQVLADAKATALQSLGNNVKIQGFRSGKVPTAVLEKHLDPASLQSEFLDLAVNALYSAAIEHENLHPVARPEVSIKKFVPFDTVEVDFTVEVVGEVKLADYKKMSLPKKAVTTTAKDVDEVVSRLRTQSAEKKDVSRAAKAKDEVWIDFVGIDTKTKKPVKGADGNNYPLILGSDTFIPGFEKNLTGMKQGEEKTFVLDFPKDYSIKALQNRSVTFTVTILKVQEVIEPKVDDEFAKKLGPFSGLDELKADIKTQLQAEKQNQADQAYSDELLTKVTEKSKVDVPESLLNEETDRLVANKKQDIVYRGQTWKEFLDDEGLTEEAYRKQLRTDAELRVKAGLVMSKVAEQEGITITPEELDMRMQLLRGQYEDPQMQAELARPEARQSIASRLLSEKTIAKLTEYATQKDTLAV